MRLDEIIISLKDLPQDLPLVFRTPGQPDSPIVAMKAEGPVFLYLGAKLNSPMDVGEALKFFRDIQTFHGPGLPVLAMKWHEKHGWRGTNRDTTAVGCTKTVAYIR